MMIYENILNILKKWNFSYDEISHEATTSCEHSSEMRKKAGLEWIGSKNIIFHAKWKFYLVTTIGTKDIKARKFKKEFGSKDIRFASQDEITQLQLWVIGSIPPFWFSNHTIPLFIDTEIFDYEYFMFNPWDPCKSIRIQTKDLKSIYSSLSNEIKYFTLNEEWVEIEK